MKVAAEIPGFGFPRVMTTFQLGKIQNACGLQIQSKPCESFFKVQKFTQLWIKSFMKRFV